MIHNSKKNYCKAVKSIIFWSFQTLFVSEISTLAPKNLSFFRILKLLSCHFWFVFNFLIISSYSSWLFLFLDFTFNDVVARILFFATPDLHYQHQNKIVQQVCALDHGGSCKKKKHFHQKKIEMKKISNEWK